MKLHENTSKTEHDLLLVDRWRTWRRFKRHRLGYISLIGVSLLIIIAVFNGFFSVNDPFQQHRDVILMPPQRVHVFDQDGRLSRPFVYGYEEVFDASTFKWSYDIDQNQKYYLQFFVAGTPYKILGLFQSHTRFLGVGDGEYFFPLGTDRFGRDLWSRMLWGGTVSLSIPVIAVSLTVVLGTIIGAVSGYYGGYVDIVIQRIIEVLASIPNLPLWMAMSVFLPPGTSGVLLYFGMAMLLSAVGWGRLAREVRGQVLSLKQQEFGQSAQAIGCSDWRIITRHMVPNCYSHIIVMTTIMIPEYLLVESALSFLGIGLTPPLTSWGVLLNDAQHVRVVLENPWLLFPGVAIFLAMLMFNFVGDGARDSL